MLVVKAERHESIVSIVVWIQMATRSVGISFVFPFAAKEIGIGLGDTHLQCRENTFSFHRQVQSKACGPGLGNSRNADTSDTSPFKYLSVLNVQE